MKSGEIIAAARRRTGLDDLGNAKCEEALRVLVNSCNAEAGLSFIGKRVAWHHLLDLVETRLRLIDYWKQKSEILEQTVLPPLFITGTPKSGSTFLHRLFAQDPNNRVPLMWEVMSPLPAPMRVTFDSDPRIIQMDKRLKWFRWTHPSIASAHPIGSLITEECGSILSCSFESFTFLDMFWIPSYETWLRSQDMDVAYEFHMNFLKHLQWLCPADRWVLKSSDHINALETLIERYPEARIVFLHRDPVRVLQSSSSQMKLLKRIFSKSIDEVLLGANEARILYDKVHKMMEFRDNYSHREEQFMDVRYLDLAQDPVGTVRTIYKHFGFTFSLYAEERMNIFAKAEHDKRTPDKYRLSHFSLDQEQEDPRFDHYCERFGIGREYL
jgi:hypothetical protein